MREHSYKLTDARRRASVLAQAIVALVVLGGMTSLSVDVGLFYTAKLELQRAADAASLAGAAAIEGGATPVDATREALTFARANPVTGLPIDAAAMEVTFLGDVDGTLVPGVTPVREVSVRLHRTRSGGNPVRLYFAQFVGLDTVDAHAASTTVIRPPAPTYNIAGIEHASFGSLGVLARVNGRLVSNGPLAVGMPAGLLVGVQGDARSATAATQRGPLAFVTGSVCRLAEPLDYPVVRLPASNDNARITANLDAGSNFVAVAAVSIPAGTYVVHDFNLLAGVAVNLQGPVTVYVTGDFNLGVAASLLGSTSYGPSSFKVRVARGGCVNFVAPILVPLNIDLYAPESDIRITVGVASFNGRLIGRSLDVLLPVAGTFTEDRTLADPLDPTPSLALTK